jgi:hypothetical protein
VSLSAVLIERLFLSGTFSVHQSGAKNKGSPQAAFLKNNFRFN